MSMTVGELRNHLKLYDDNTELSFGSNIFGVPLVFYRVKSRGENLVQIELNEDFQEPGKYTVEFDGSNFSIQNPSIK